MGIDYDGVGGIGIELTDNMIQTAIKKGIFTQEMWKEDQDHCLDILGFTYSDAGNYYSGDIKTYLFVDGNNLGEINKNALDFIEKLKQFDIIYSVDDIELIEDVRIS